MGLIAVDSATLTWQESAGDWPRKQGAGVSQRPLKSIWAEGGFTNVQLAQYSRVEKAHSHTSAELLFILEGRMVIGRGLTVTAGRAIFGDKDSVSGQLVAGSGGATFIRVEVPG